MSDQSTADRAFKAFLDTAWGPNFDGSAKDDAPGEPRGNTHWGVIRATWETEVAHGCPVSDPNFDTAPKSDFAIVLRWACWKPIRGDELSAADMPGIAILLANMAMGSGAKESVELLQRAIGVDDDGQFGQITWLATVHAAATRPNFIAELTKVDDVFFETLGRDRPDKAKFVGGWEHRAGVFEAVAKAFV